MLFDSHAHLNCERYGEAERRAVIAAIERSDVGCVIDVGFDLKSSALAVEHAARYPWCYAAVGVHPHDAAKMDEDALARLGELSTKPKVVAIGEIGLDYFRSLSPQDDQRYWFRKQIRLAMARKLPIIIHDRDSAGEAAEILTEEGVFGSERRAVFPNNPTTGRANAGVLFHCFSDTADRALAYIGLGATISLSGTVTYRKNKVTPLVAERIPLAHLLIETDAPYLAPEPHRGKDNVSPYVYHTAKRIAEIRGVGVSEIEEATCANAKRFFNIPAV
ncbi:MAG: TatD family hydrolase [Clostridiales Family XIII bacterium]|jgi:TatD DNase family protein|nr:TatD family hydrolase [Clostridiales Family XIII bacterium]